MIMIHNPYQDCHHRPSWLKLELRSTQSLVAPQQPASNYAQTIPRGSIVPTLSCLFQPRNVRLLIPPGILPIPHLLNHPQAAGQWLISTPTSGEPHSYSHDFPWFSMVHVSFMRRSFIMSWHPNIHLPLSNESLGPFGSWPLSSVRSLMKSIQATSVLGWLPTLSSSAFVKNENV